jgi:hypothetical protein
MVRMLLLTLAVGCGLEDPSTKDTCRTSADCNSGQVCDLKGKCVAPIESGPCGGLPPASCSSAEGDVHHLTASELQRLLPGRWLWCKGEVYNGVQLRIGPPTSVGIEFNSDATSWWELEDDGHGQPVRQTDAHWSGSLQLESYPGFAPVQVSLVTDTGHIRVVAEITDGPPLHLRLRTAGGGGYAYYVLAASDCGGALQPGYAGAATPGAFGGACDIDLILPNTCPSIGGVSCSMCAAPGTNTWQCVQPCSLSGGSCPTGQSCQAVEHSRGGDCVGFDGYCH